MHNITRNGFWLNILLTFYNKNVEIKKLKTFFVVAIHVLRYQFSSESPTFFLPGLVSHRLHADVIARLQARVMVEQVGNECQVQFVVATDNVGRIHETATS